MKKYQNKYRIPSARAQWWNYGWNGAYFVTICTAHRKCIFGNVVDEKMVLSRIGILADIFWYTIPQHFQHVELGEFVVMPNHVHGILILNNPGNGKSSESADSPPPMVQTLHVQTLHATSAAHCASPIKNQKMADISPNAKTISTIIRSYKSAVTKHANRLGLENGWQPRFHDHIVRNDTEYQRISNYIINNPKNWKGDKFFS